MLYISWNRANKMVYTLSCGWVKTFFFITLLQLLLLCGSPIMGPLLNFTLFFPIKLNNYDIYYV